MDSRSLCCAWTLRNILTRYVRTFRGTTKESPPAATARITIFRNPNCMAVTHSCVRETCVRRLPAAWGVTVCRISLPFARECRLGVWFGFVGAALLPAVGTCVVLAFGAMPGRCCFLRVTHLSSATRVPAAVWGPFDPCR